MHTYFLFWFLILFQEGTPHFLSKVQQLYDMMDLSDGVMLLGKAIIVIWTI